jgi:hypothetical protein
MGYSGGFCRVLMIHLGDMTVSLTHELRQALADHPGELLELIDDASRARYVLIPAEQFDRLKALLTVDDFEIQESYSAQNETLARAGWDDPELDIYNDYDGNHS